MVIPVVDLCLCGACSRPQVCASSKVKCAKLFLRENFEQLVMQVRSQLVQCDADFAEELPADNDTTREVCSPAHMPILNAAAGEEYSSAKPPTAAAPRQLVCDCT